MLRCLDLFSGIGGFALGLKRAGINTVAFCECDKNCRRVLRKHWENTPVFPDIESLDSTCLGEIEIITGGFPCQPFSTASSGRKVAADLWPEMLRLIREFKPRWVIAENVLPYPINKAKKDLEDIKYNVWSKRIGADEAGADHKRHRWWLCAHTNDQGKFHSTIDAEVAMLPELCRGVWGAENYTRAIRVSNGLSDRMDRTRLKMLGNTVLPYIPQAIAQGIVKYETNNPKAVSDYE